MFAENIDCGYSLEPLAEDCLGEAVPTSNEYPQSMFWSKNKKNRFFYQWGLKGYTFHEHIFVM